MLVRVNLDVLVKILPLHLTIMFGEVKAPFSSSRHVVYWYPCPNDGNQAHVILPLHISCAANDG